MTASIWPRQLVCFTSSVQLASDADAAAAADVTETTATTFDDYKWK